MNKVQMTLFSRFWRTGNRKHKKNVLRVVSDELSTI